ncbi:MAG: flagellar hook-basal body complex protein FliE [Rhizobiaceae bacterium]|jgi:flagellar hook-basal body complex protein FliE|nr:flagellar hook-basal body complex protein FliE [Hyphomicrobiales bacterium]
MINPLSLVGSIGSGTIGQAGAATGTTTAGATGGVAQTFESALANAAGNAVESLGHAQAVSIDALQGKADTREVVDAVMNAQETLSAAIAIRDKIVAAYLDVSRMSI